MAILGYFFTGKYVFYPISLDGLTNPIQLLVKIGLCWITIYPNFNPMLDSFIG